MRWGDLEKLDMDRLVLGHRGWAVGVGQGMGDRDRDWLECNQGKRDLQLGCQCQGVQGRRGGRDFYMRVSSLTHGVTFGVFWVGWCGIGHIGVMEGRGGVGWCCGQGGSCGNCSALDVHLN